MVARGSCQTKIQEAVKRGRGTRRSEGKVMLERAEEIGPVARALLPI
jgi:hypothetical protein